MDCTMRLKNLFKGSQHQVGLVQRKELLQVCFLSWDTVFMLGSILLFRKRCMDLVSFETRQEYDWVKGFIDGGVNIFRSYV